MKSFNSTTRLFKDMLQLLENEALEPQDIGYPAPRETYSYDPQSSIPSRHSWRRRSENTWPSPETRRPEHSSNRCPERSFQPRTALSFTFAANKGTANTYQPPMEMAPQTFPGTEIDIDPGSPSRLHESEQSHLLTDENAESFAYSAARCGMDAKYLEPPERPRSARSAVRDLTRIATLPSIDEDNEGPSPSIQDIEPSAQDIPPSTLDIAPSTLDNPPSSPCEESLPLLEASVSREVHRDHDSIVGNLRRSHASEAFSLSSAPGPVASYTREAEPPISSDGRPVASDYSRSLVLSKALLNRYKSHVSTSSSRPTLEEPNRSRSNDDDATHADENLEDSFFPPDNTIAASCESEATGSLVDDNSTNVTSLRAKRRRTTRFEPSDLGSMIKNRASIDPPNLKNLTPEQLLRRMSKSLLNQAKPSRLPLMVHPSGASSSRKHRTAITEDQPNAIPGVNQNSGDRSNKDKRDWSLMPPTTLLPRSAQRPPRDKRHHRSKRLFDVESSRSQATSSHLGTAHEAATDRMLNAHDDMTADEYTLNEDNLQHDGNARDDVEDNVEDMEDRNIKRRTAKAPVLYRLPDLNRKLFPGDPGTYSLNTPIRPARVSEK